MADIDSIWRSLQSEDEYKTAELLQKKKSKPKTNEKRKEKVGTSTANQKSDININSVNHALKLLSQQTTQSVTAQLQCVYYIDRELSSLDRRYSESDLISVLKGLLKLLVSKSEKCRLLSVSLVCKFINMEMWSFESISRYIIPTIFHCIDNDAKEESEEVRLQLLVLTQTIIEFSQNETQLKPIASQMIAILLKCLSDNAPQNAKKCCQIWIDLSSKIRLNNIAESAIEASLHLLSHRHSSVRISAIELIGFLLLNGGHKSIPKLTAFREYNVVPLQWWFGTEMRANYFGALCRHPKISVRKAFYQMIFDITLQMRERYDYETLLLSYVLSGLADDCPPIRQNAFDKIEKIGLMYESDNLDDLKKSLFYQSKAESISRMHLSGVSPLLFEPFHKRPNLGSRLMVRKHFKRVIKAILSEISDWKAQCRIMSLKLLRNCLFYTEEYATEETDSILKALITAMDSSELRNTALECCHCIGRYVYPTQWIESIEDNLTSQCDTTDDRTIAQLLKALLMFCPPLRIAQFNTNIHNICDKLDCHSSYINDIKHILNSVSVDDNNGSEQTMNSDDEQLWIDQFRGFHLNIVEMSDEP